jgi:hypothetical protein
MKIEMNNGNKGRDGALRRPVNAPHTAAALSRLNLPIRRSAFDVQRSLFAVLCSLILRLFSRRRILCNGNGFQRKPRRWTQTDTNGHIHPCSKPPLTIRLRLERSLPSAGMASHQSVTTRPSMARTRMDTNVRAFSAFLNFDATLVM